MVTQRQDLSRPGCDVIEYRLRAHDGAQLWGLFARPAWQTGRLPARIRSVGPAERPEIDPKTLADGFAEFVFQEPAGRKLADRVLDVVRICQMAFRTEGIDRLQVSFSCPTEAREPDEFVIAQHLFAGKFC